MIFAKQAKSQFWRGAFGEYQMNMKWIDIGYSNSMNLAKQAKAEISTGPIQHCAPGGGKINFCKF